MHPGIHVGGICVGAQVLKRQITYGWSAFCLDVEFKLAFKKHIKHIM